METGGTPLSDATGGNPFDAALDVGNVHTEAGGGTPPTESGAPPTAAQYQELQARLERFKPLEVFAEAMQDPTAAARIRAAVFGGGAPPSANPTPAVDPQIAVNSQVEAIQTRYNGEIRAALENGDQTKAIQLAAMMGAEVSGVQSEARLRSAAAPLVGMTAQNTIDNWCNNKRQSSELFKKLEPQFRALVAQTAPDKMAQLTANGSLVTALEVGWQKVVTENYESAYNKTIAGGGSPPQNVPPYSMGTAGGAPPPRERLGASGESEAEVKDDVAWQKFMEEKGVRFSVDERTGTIVGEI